MAELGRDSGRERSVTKGVEVMADQWRSGKAQAALIDNDVASYEHVPCQRKRASGGYEDGFLVAGAAAITFLAPDEKTVVSSHPLGFLESYGQDSSVDELFVYSLKQRHVLKRGDLMHFSFKVASAERVQFLASSIDRNTFSGGAKKEDKLGLGKLAPRQPRTSVGMPKRASTGPNKKDDFADVWDGRFADIHNPNDMFDSKEKYGMRFVGSRSFVSATAQRGEAFKEEKQQAIAIVNRVGIAVLTFEAGKGWISHYVWDNIKSFGAAGDDCFGFKVLNKSGQEEFVVISTGESAKKMDALSAKNAKANENLKIESERDRSRTVGVEIMKVGFLGGKAQQEAALQADIKAFDHVPCARKKRSSDETQKGFLVVGTSTVTFLGEDKEVIMSHPLGFLESYERDADFSAALTYSLKQKSALKRGKTLTFTFLIESEEKVNEVLSSLDRYLFSVRATSGGFSGVGRKSGGMSPRASGASVSPRTSGVSPRLGSQRSSARASGTTGFSAIWDGQFRDLALPGDPIPTESIKGKRFIGARCTLNSTTNLLGPKSPGTAIINDYGVNVLQCNQQKGTIESHPWRSIKSFGVAGSNVFGFQTSAEKSGSEEYVCFVTDDSAMAMDVLANSFLEQQGIATSETRERTQTRGVEVMSDGWMTEKTRNALIDQDVKSFEHVAAQRKRQTTDGFEEGFLVVGITAVTFLGLDGTPIASHPLSFLEAYVQDLHDPLSLTYTLKKGRGSLDEPLSFSFKMNSAEQVQAVISSIDRNSFFQVVPDGNSFKAPELAPPSMGTGKMAKPEPAILDPVFHDKTSVPELPALPDGSDAPEMPPLPPVQKLEGHRVCCVKTYMSDKKMSVISSAPKVRATALFTLSGIIFLQRDKNSGVLETYPWSDVVSFGATGDDCFGFKVEAHDPDGQEGGGFVCCYTMQSGHLMNVLAKKYSKLAAAGEGPSFPREYRP